MNLGKYHILLITIAILSLAACSPRIHGMIQLVDPNLNPVRGESPEGTVINMINTSVSVEKASHSVTADKEGKFQSVKGAITPGLFKVEANRIGYMTETKEVKLGSLSSKKVNMKLKKIPESKRRSIRRSRTDEDKIINPGEVNIQPPSM